MKKAILLLTIMSLNFLGASAQISQKKELLYSNRFSILAGLIQPTVLKGGNIEINYFTRRMSFDYSHGFSLNPPVVGDFADQQVVLHLPYSTGFGIGYRITSFFDIRVEPKWHSWEVYYKGDAQAEARRIKDFNTFTLGIGMYYRYMPFKNSDSSFLQGITTSSSIRWWQNVNSTLSGDSFTYANKITGKNEVLKTPNIGFANTPIIINVGVGYTFGGR
jgi:hypothetical protein